MFVKTRLPNLIVAIGQFLGFFSFARAVISKSHIGTITCKQSASTLKRSFKEIALPDTSGAHTYNAKKVRTAILFLSERARWSSLERRRRGDGRRRFLTVLGKGSKTRTVRISAETIRALDAIRTEGEFVFSGRFGGHLDPSQAWRIVRAAATRAGVKKSRQTALPTARPRVTRARQRREVGGRSQ